MLVIIVTLGYQARYFPAIESPSVTFSNGRKLSLPPRVQRGSIKKC